MPQRSPPDPIDAGDTSSPHLASERNFADASTFRGGPWADAHIIETGMDADRFPREVVDQGVLGRAVERFRRDRIPLPAFRELAEPSTIPGPILAALGDVGADEAHPLNLFRVHGYKGADRMRRVEVPQHVELPSELTGVDARIVVALGDRFPDIGAHKVLAVREFVGAGSTCPILSPLGDDVRAMIDAFAEGDS